MDLSREFSGSLYQGDQVTKAWNVIGKAGHLRLHVVPCTKTNKWKLVAKKDQSKIWECIVDDGFSHKLRDNFVQWSYIDGSKQKLTYGFRIKEAVQAQELADTLSYIMAGPPSNERQLHISLPSKQQISLCFKRSLTMATVLKHISAQHGLDASLYALAAVTKSGHSPLRAQTIVADLETSNIAMVKRVKPLAAEQEKPKEVVKQSEETMLLSVTLPNESVCKVTVRIDITLLELQKLVCFQNGLNPPAHKFDLPIANQDKIKLKQLKMSSISLVRKEGINEDTTEGTDSGVGLKTKIRVAPLPPKSPSNRPRLQSSPSTSPFSKRGQQPRETTDGPRKTSEDVNNAVSKLLSEQARGRANSIPSSPAKDSARRKLNPAPPPPLSKHGGGTVKRAAPPPPSNAAKESPKTSKHGMEQVDSGTQQSKRYVPQGAVPLPSMANRIKQNQPPQDDFNKLDDTSDDSSSSNATPTLNRPPNSPGKKPARKAPSKPPSKENPSPLMVHQQLTQQPQRNTGTTKPSPLMQRTIVTHQQPPPPTIATPSHQPNIQPNQQQTTGPIAFNFPPPPPRQPPPPPSADNEIPPTNEDQRLAKRLQEKPETTQLESDNESNSSDESMSDEAGGYDIQSDNDDQGTSDAESDDSSSSEEGAESEDDSNESESVHDDSRNEGGDDVKHSSTASSADSSDDEEEGTGIVLLSHQVTDPNLVRDETVDTPTASELNSDIERMNQLDEKITSLRSLIADTCEVGGGSSTDLTYKKQDSNEFDVTSISKMGPPPDNKPDIQISPPPLNVPPPPPIGVPLAKQPPPPAPKPKPPPPAVKPKPHPVTKPNMEDELAKKLQRRQQMITDPDSSNASNSIPVVVGTTGNTSMGGAATVSGLSVGVGVNATGIVPPTAGGGGADMQLQLQMLQQQMLQQQMMQLQQQFQQMQSMMSVNPNQAANLQLQQQMQQIQQLQLLQQQGAAGGMLTANPAGLMMGSSLQPNPAIGGIGGLIPSGVPGIQQPLTTSLMPPSTLVPPTSSLYGVNPSLLATNQPIMTPTIQQPQQQMFQPMMGLPPQPTTSPSPVAPFPSSPSSPPPPTIVPPPPTIVPPPPAPPPLDSTLTSDDPTTKPVKSSLSRKPSEADVREKALGTATGKFDSLMDEVRDAKPTDLLKKVPEIEKDQGSAYTGMTAALVEAMKERRKSFQDSSISQRESTGSALDWEEDET